MTPTAPELTTRFAQDFVSLAGGRHHRLALAVSGGSDSLALLLLASAAYPGGVEAATVDHGIRPESPAEAARVAGYCAMLGVPHETLAVEVAMNGEGLQSAARAARYAALEGWMARRGVTALLTAHHLDDQAETILMRLARGSGVAGLAGIRPVIPLEGFDATLYRPLLSWRRAELADIVIAAGLEPADDPSNADERFARTRIRRRLADNPWLDPAALARSAAALAEADDALAQAADTLFETRVRRGGSALTLDPAGLPPELLRRLVGRCLRVLAADAAPRGEQLGTLLASLARGSVMTLAGIKCGGGRFYLFEPAAPRRPHGHVRHLV